MQLFYWQEIILLIIPPILLVLLANYHSQLKKHRFFPGFRWIQTLIPTWYMMIMGYSWLNYGFEISNFIWFFTSGILLLHLYGYVMETKIFNFNDYFIKATQLLLLLLSVFLTSSVILRIIWLIFQWRNHF